MRRRRCADRSGQAGREMFRARRDPFMVALLDESLGRLPDARLFLGYAKSLYTYTLRLLPIQQITQSTTDTGCFPLLIPLYFGEASTGSRVVCTNDNSTL